MKKKLNKLTSKEKSESKALNPFEVHINRSKYQILGQKSKDDHGLPGVSRGKAFKKREKTLLNEYRDRYKDSKFVDLRLGEKNASLDPEHKVMLRLAAEKKKQFSKKSLYNLNDDEQLTHGGEALNEESIKNWATFSDEDEDDILDASFVKEKHFGGDIFTRPKDSDENEKFEEGSSNKPKSRKEWIEEIILESKKKKAESRKDKEEQNEAVTKLNSQFQDFLSLMKGRRLTEEDKEKCKKTCEFREYDMFVNEFAFDRSKRAKPSSRLKTEEEIAKEEQEKLRKLEEERLRRMRGEESTIERSFKSADSLDDGLELVPRKLTITERQASPDASSKVDLKKKFLKEGPKADKGGDEGDSSADESECEADDEENSEEDDLEEEKEQRKGSDKDTEDQSSEEESTDDEDEDDYSDVLEEESDEDEISEDVETPNTESKSVIEGKEKKKTRNRIEIQGEATRKEESQMDDNVISHLEELPFTFEVPSEYDEFWELLVGRTPADVSTIVGRMITCNHPSLGADNKSKTNFIFAYILQTLHIICSSEPEFLLPSQQPLLYVDSFISHLYTITQLNPTDCAAALTQVIDEKYEEYQSTRPRKYPDAGTFIFLKVAGLLFPASDYHHDVMTRVITFLTQILGESRVTCGREAVALLFTSSLLFEYLNRSQRFIGELVNGLCGIIYFSIPSSPHKHLLPHYPPFKSSGPFSDLLVIEIDESVSEGFVEKKLQFSQLNGEIALSNNLKITILNESLKLLTKLSQKWTHLSAVRAIFGPVRKLIQEIPSDVYPECISSNLKELNNTIAALPPQVPHLKKIEGQLKTLRMSEPSFEKVMDGIKKRSGSRELQEKQKLIHKLKRERKGAKRELKRDTQFLARQQLKEVLASDAERKRKVNLIMQGLATQESEYKKYKLGK